MKRKCRKTSIYQRGIEKFDFDVNKEFKKYKFLCAEKMTKRQEKSLSNDERFSTYMEWEKYIKDKYSNYPVDGLREFSRYLNHWVRKASPTREFISPCVSAVFSCMLTFYVTNIFNVKFGDLALDVWILAIFIIIGLCCSSISWIVVKISELFFDNSIRENFLKDYKEIIDNIIKEKV